AQAGRARRDRRRRDRRRLHHRGRPEDRRRGGARGRDDRDPGRRGRRRRGAGPAASGMTLAARPPRPEDAAAVAALVNAYNAAYGGDGAWTVADVEDEWRTAADVWLVERAGELAGHATLRSSDRGRLQALGWTHPAHAGHGVGGLLVDLTERRAVELGGTAVVRNSVLAADGVARRLLEGRGYAAESRNLRMRIDLDALPRPPTPPPGVAVASFRPGVDDAEVDACVEEAFERRWTHQAEWRQ